MGAGIALPFLEAMVPALTGLAQSGARPPVRFGAVFVPNGAIMPQWTPAGVSTGFEFSPVLKPLEAFRDSLVVISNLVRANEGGGHAGSAAGWLTGAAAKFTEAEDIRAGITIDQVVAARIGRETPFRSLELATEDFTGYIGACVTGYSCAYVNTISWSSPTTPLPMSINPRVVFESLFGEPGTPDQRATRRRRDLSILDFIRDETRRLDREIGVRDRARLDQYLENIRGIERRIQHAEAHHASELTPVGIPGSYEEHVELMYDLLAVAWEADLTRVFTFMAARELSNRTYPQAGVPEQHHQVSHHRNVPETMAQVVKINAYHTALFARFVEKLRSLEDGDGSLLDHALIVYGGGMGDPNVHARGPLPIVLIGGGVGRGDRHLMNPEGTPVGNLWLAVAHRYGIERERFGESTGSVDL